MLSFYSLPEGKAKCLDFFRPIHSGSESINLRKWPKVNEFWALIRVNTLSSYTFDNDFVSRSSAPQSHSNEFASPAILYVPSCWT